MILDAVPYDRLPNDGKVGGKSVQAFIHFLEGKLGIKAVYDLRNIPFGRIDLLDQFQIAHKLIEKGVLRSFVQVRSLPDEPPLFVWGCAYGKNKESHSGGSSFSSDSAALTSALAEGVERYLWHTQQDHFVSPVRATTAEITAYGPRVAPERFTAFSEDQRKQAPSLFLREEASYLWIQGRSLCSGKKVYLPAQTVSPTVPGAGTHTEPLIRQQHTNGLATWPTLAGARLAGVLELLEREALMVMWFNQLTLPLIDLESIRTKNKDLDGLLTSCARYHLAVHAIRMITDAPTHAVCVVVEDLSAMAPRLTLGLKAHRSLPHAIERALNEALRTRSRHRNFFLNGGTWDSKTLVKDIGHIDRLYYWDTPERSARLGFLIAGKKIPDTSDSPWEHDTEVEHLERIVAWCKENNFECVSVSLGTSRANVTPWHVEMVVLPELHSIHLHEKFKQLATRRLHSVPQSFGYTPRSEPFIDAPHPFC